MKTIQDELRETDAWLDRQTWGGTDYDGTSFDVEPNEEMQEALARQSMLEELMHLKEPINYSIVKPNAGANTFGSYDESPWGIAMAFGHCPCPGVPRERWDSDYYDEVLGDPMGDMMGRNA